MRNKLNFDNGWKFRFGDMPPYRETDGWGGAKARAYSFGAASSEYDDSEWRSVDLPHDFVAEREYCFKSGEDDTMTDIPEMESIGSRLFAGGCLEGGIGWYRKHLTVDKNCVHKRIYIHFDGVYRDSTLYVNQYYVGEHKSGYTSFYYDITDFVNIGSDNIIAVRVDASGREGWWYEGGGIYRHVWIETVSNVHIEPCGISIEPVVDLETDTAFVNIGVNVINKCVEDKSVWVEVEIKNKEGRMVTRCDHAISVESWSSGNFTSEISIKNAKLWDLDNPYLYTAVVRLYLNEKVCDTQKITFGIRDIRFDSKHGFYLNGKNVKIKGLCCHQDHAGMGIAVSESVNDYRIDRLISMGANAVRISHYPASPELLDICDRKGVLVFEETRRMSAASEDIENLKAMVKRDRNHPSIFLWGIGNEEIFSQHRPETVRATQTMKAEIRKLDKLRPITSAVVCWDGERRYDNARMYIDVTKNLDVMGFNYCSDAWDDYHERMPSQPIIVTEASSNSGTRGCYETDESRGQYCIFDDDNETKCKSGKKAVKKDMGENMLNAVMERDYLAGVFLWTGFDYRGEPTPLNYPAVYSQFGVFDYCGFPKDNYYYYKSWWQTTDVLHIFPHWNHNDGDVLTVYCYTNLDEAELFVNGKSRGKKSVSKYRYLTWDNVIYEKGEVRAVGYRGGKAVLEDAVKTTGKAYKINAEAYKSVVNIGDTVIINISIADKDGNIVPTAENKISFDVSGCGKFIGCGNGNPGDHDSDFCPERRAFGGLCQLLVKAMDKGEIKITASSDGLEQGVCIVEVQQ